MAFGAELLTGMPERAMNACVTRSLPDVWLDFVHIVESRNIAVSDKDFGAAHRDGSPVLKRRKYRSANRAAENRVEAAIPI